MSELYIDPATLSQQQANAAAPTVIDMRSAEEFAAGHLPGALHIPADQLAERLAEVDPSRPVVTY